MVEVERPPLKQLGIVERYASWAASYGTAAAKVYQSARSRAPAFVVPYVAQAESLVSAYASPAAAYAVDTADKTLYWADAQVDAAVKKANATYKQADSTVKSTVDSVFQMHAANVETAKAAATRYFDLVQSTSAWVLDKVSPSKNIKLAKDTLDAAVAKAKTLSDPDVAYATVLEAWASFSSIPAVGKVLSTAEPVTKAGVSAFLKVHDTLVASPYYKKGLTTSASVASYAATTTPYKLGASYAWPLVAPVADPAISTVSKSKVFNDTVDFWAPSS